MFRTCLVIVAVLVTLPIILLVSFYLLSGVKVEIVNRGPLSMKDVYVEVRGRSYSLGEIPAGTSKTVKVRPASESAVSIKHRDGKGKQHTLFVDTYIESGFSGKITVHVGYGKIKDVKDNIKLTPIS